MNNYPLVSILIPVYGVEQYIARCAKSLFEQSYSNIEYIFVNDCTKDRSIEILQNVIKKYPNRKGQVRIIEHKYNRGLAATRNTAMKEAMGEFIKHVDADDWMEKDSIELMINEQRKCNADIVLGGIYEHYLHTTNVINFKCYNSSHALAKDILSRRIPVNVWYSLYRRSLYIVNRIKVKEGVNMGEDYQVTPLLAYYANNVTTVNKALYHYNLQNQNSMVHGSSESDIIQVIASFDILKKFFFDKSEFLPYLYEAEYKMAIGRMKRCSQVLSNKKYFYISRGIIANIPRMYRIGLSLPYRLIYILHFFSIVRWYVKIIRVLLKIQ